MGIQSLAEPQIHREQRRGDDHNLNMYRRSSVSQSRRRGILLLAPTTTRKALLNVAILLGLAQRSFGSAAAAAAATTTTTTTTTTLFGAPIRRHLDNSESFNGDGLSPTTQTEIRAYELWKPDEIRATVLKWAEHYPTLITVTTAQEAYGLPTAGTSEDCPFETENPGCLNYILTLQDLEAHPSGSDSSRRLPELLWSGELHGNERVGPTAVLEAVDLLLEATSCEALPRRALQPPQNTAATEDTTNINSNNLNDVWQQELKRARSCRSELARKGISDAQRQWLARLATTRRIVVVPTANALGYYQNKREENGIDPNRDFPYDLPSPNLCMQTIAGRTLNEVFRQHLFQLSLTFHGGMEVVGYEWGAPTWEDPSQRSPDDTAQTQIAAAYSKYAGGWSSTRPYAYGPYVLYKTRLCFWNGSRYKSDSLFRPPTPQLNQHE